MKYKEKSWIGCIIHNISIVGATVFLCIHFNTLWALLALFFMASYSSDEKIRQEHETKRFKIQKGL